jgi:hypothetical protein
MLMDTLRRLGNYDSVFAIHKALTCSAVTRLSATWELVNQYAFFSKLSVFSHFVGMQENIFCSRTKFVLVELRRIVCTILLRTDINCTIIVKYGRVGREQRCTRLDTLWRLKTTWEWMAGFSAEVMPFGHLVHVLLRARFQQQSCANEGDIIICMPFFCFPRRSANVTKVLNRIHTFCAPTANYAEYRARLKNVCCMRAGLHTILVPRFAK